MRIKFINWMKQVNGKVVEVKDVENEEIMGDTLDDVIQGVVHYTDEGKEYYSYDGKGFKFESVHGW